MTREPRGDEARTIQRFRLKERNPMGKEPGENAIRERAHEIWIEEGMPDGNAVDHWLRAKWELEQAPGPKAELDRLEHEFEPARKTAQTAGPVESGSKGER
jgi:hypothetical protein